MARLRIRDIDTTVIEAPRKRAALQRSRAVERDAAARWLAETRRLIVRLEG